MNEQKPVLAYFHFPKTGGSFLGYYLRAFLQPYFKGMGHPIYTDVAAKVQGLYKFGFIRHPYAWYVSRYFYYARPDFKTEGGILKGCDAGISGAVFTDRFPTFKSHMLWGFANVPNFSQLHSYKRMFYDENDKLAMDFIGPIINMQDDLNYVLRINNIPMPAISLNQYYEQLRAENEQLYTNRSYHGQVMDYYDDELKELVLKHDKFIFDQHNYDINGCH